MSTSNALVRPGLAQLRALPGIIKCNEEVRPVFPFSLWKGGIPRGALTEVSGSRGCGKTTAVLRFLAENPSLRMSWVEEIFTAYPCVFPRLGVSLSRCLFVEAGKDFLWASSQCLRSQLFQVVVLMGGEFEGRDLKRLQLAAEQSQSSVILLREKPLEEAWSLRQRLVVQGGSVRLLRSQENFNKGGSFRKVKNPVRHMQAI